MQIYETDLLRIDKVGHPGGEAYLARTSERTLLFDSGFAYSAPALVEELEELLGERALDSIFLSHSHYDHASGSVWVKERWPGAVICGSAHAAHVLERPGARDTILALNYEATKTALEFGRISDEQANAVDYAPLAKLAIDEIVDDGSIIDMGSITFEVIAAPGHTRCSLMLWCPDERLLFGSESLGLMLSDDIVGLCCLTGYYDCLATIARAQSLEPEHIVTSHREVVSGAQATRYLENAHRWAEKIAHLVWESHAKGMDKDQIAAEIEELFFTQTERKSYQPKAAFDLNTKILIDLLLATKNEPLSQ